MKKSFGILMIFLLILSAASFGFAHFGMIIPSDSMVMQKDNRTVSLRMSFSHPFEGIGMEMVKPKTLIEY